MPFRSFLKIDTKKGVLAPRGCVNRSSASQHLVARSVSRVVRGPCPYFLAAKALCFDWKYGHLQRNTWLTHTISRYKLGVKGGWLADVCAAAAGRKSVSDLLLHGCPPGWTHHPGSTRTCGCSPSSLGRSFGRSPRPDRDRLVPAPPSTGCLGPNSGG